MLTRGSQTLAWDVDNRVTSVTTGGSTTTMEYDYSGMRVKKNAPTGISLCPFQSYEIDPNGVITKFIRIGIESFASKNGTKKYFTTMTPYPVLRGLRAFLDGAVFAA